VTVAGIAIAGCATHKPAPKIASVPPIQFRDVTDAAGLRCTRVNGAFGKKWFPATITMQNDTKTTMTMELVK